PALRGLARGPVGNRLGKRLRGMACLEREVCGGGELPHALPDRVWRGDVSEAQEEREGLAVHGRRERGVGAEGLELGGEEDRAAEPPVVERLLAEAVADEMKP